jgi:DNA-binding YbaB/EbfC family protein
MAKRKLPNRPKAMGGGLGGGQAGMMQQLQQLQEQLLSEQNKLADEKVTGTAGGGAVQVTITGDQRCHDVKIDAAILQDGDVELLQDMIVTAFNNALEKSRELADQRLSPLTSGLGGLGLGL